ncbi:MULTISPECIES: SfnB family sulfur acquisition oxidoreductase [unclassified Aureimonas]|uniref:SfnB family sulfur acquisition oxidoreductase n=1 Tax=unclassified Aureimonas TaxID=2615206 RepID=UPI0006FBC239|nr:MULTISPECIES: SfnB family sulfur acquisition oxidoreductase [unclassified Aureimonas]KQT52467.1 SfnB family sulfur acquisition oxidoreductase [Aureimonas sp. Leaf427]KQT77632.1 SfnB family sulfur acquisition oxidoreductase [Aureimonas sp. Leaf460]
MIGGSLSPKDASEAAKRSPLPPTRPHLIGDDAEALDVARRLAADFAVGAAQRDAERRLPFEEIERYTASGLGGITIPREHGGADVSFVTLAEVFAILCAADPALGQIPQNQFGVIALLREHGTPEQKARLFADVLAGKRIGNAGPEKGGASMLHMKTRLTRTPEGLRLTGRRFYSTGAIFAHWIPTRALDEEDRPVQVWVPHDAPGVTVIDDWSSFGQRTTASGSVVFDNVSIDPGDVLPVHAFAERPGLSGPISQIIQAAIDLGIARGAFADTLAFVRDRSRPWMDSGVAAAVEDPTIRQSVGGLATNLHAAEEVLREAAEVLDRIAAKPVTDLSSAEASLAVAEAKILTTEIALEASETLFDLAGSSATRAAHNLDRHWRNARVHTLHDPVRWKFHLLGNHALNGALPRRHQWN